MSLNIDKNRMSMSWFCQIFFIKRILSAFIKGPLAYLTLLLYYSSVGIANMGIEVTQNMIRTYLVVLCLFYWLKTNDMFLAQFKG